MNERLPESSRLPIRAIVMVLLFLGVVFLLVGLNELNSDTDSAASNALTTATPTSATAAPSTSKPADAPAKSEVRVYNIGGTDGAGATVADKLREAGWDVTATENLDLPDVTATTVYYGDTEGEKEDAEEVGKVLDAPVEQRVAALADQPPGVVVAVIG